MSNFRTRLRNFLFPPRGSSRWILILPYAILGVFVISLLIGGAYTWEYTNSPSFCGTSCHTMPPEYAAYGISPHARIYCVECHIGREFVGNQIFRKAGDMRHVIAAVFQTYEYPIRVKNMRPAPEICEKCHSPEKFSDDSLRLIHRYADDRLNTASTIYLILKTGGGDARIGNARGIHWHIASKVLYYSSDELSQEIPYVRVYNEDGTFTEYTDIESDFDPASVDESQLKPMDCITCHNRVTHEFMNPVDSVDLSMSRGLIDPSIPLIHVKAVEALSATYATREDAIKAIADIEKDYRNNLFDYYSQNGQKVKQAVAEIQAIYDRTVFQVQKINPTTYPNNLGHINSPGCFRCHDGKHLNDQDEAVRLECNICHSIPVVADQEDFLTNIEISSGPEPETHLNPNWINLHNQAIGPSCSNCHTTSDPGGTSNTSFCSNSACHGNVFTFAGFDAPALREILKSQLPPPEPELEVPVFTGDPTYENYVGILLTVKCTGCHIEGDAAPEGLDLSTYEATMRGSNNGAVIVPGDAENSLLIQVQSVDHFNNFTSDELDIVRQWINLGAPE